MRVFVSYSHDSTSHTDRVLALADRLRSDGIDVRLDQYISNPPEGWPRWMQNQLRESDFTLLVCTPLYRRRFDGDENPGTGKGATWEGMIAQQILHDASTLNHKLIPVIFEDGEYEDIPLTLRPFTHHRLPAGYDDLYRQLTGQPKTPAPPLGPIRTMPPASRGGQQIDNRGAIIGQQINLSGTANLGSFIILRSDQGRENPVAPELIANAFAGLRTRPRLVVFATCNSAELARRASTHVAHAIGFAGEVEDATARKFGEVFYERLASREDFDVPFAFARAKLATLGSGYGDVELARLFP